MANTLDLQDPGSLHVLTSALAATTSGILITDPGQPDNPIIYANPGFERMTGYGGDEVLGQNCRFLQGKDTSKADVDKLRATIARGEGSKTTLLNYRKDGTPFWNELSISPVYDGDRLTHFIGVQTDVTAREQAVQLKAALDLAESLYETIREGLLILDRDLRVFRANRAFYTMFGVTPEETLERPLYELGDHQWDIPALRELLETILPTKNPLNDFEVEHEFPRIGRRVMHLNARRVDREGLPEFILLAFEDITRRHDAEEEMVLRAEALAQRDRAKDEFLAMLSHELRNPLNAIAGALYLLEPSASGDEEVAAPLGIATRQVETMTALINDLLEVSRITQGKVALKRSRISISELLLVAIRSTEVKLAVRDGITIGSQIAPDLFIEADSLRLDQVFQNLLGNAIKFTREGEILVRLSEEAGSVVVTVQDPGIGIDPELLPHVFELFRQGERTLARSEGGLGIGLTIAYQLVALHGGNLEVSSEGRGCGTTFTVRLPKTVDAVPASIPSTEPAAETPKTLTAIVVDDNVDGANILVKLLSRQGYVARAAYHGDEAVPVMRETKPDVVFLDIGLPGKDGYAIAEEVRRDPDLQGTFLVALTGYGQDEDRERAHRAGFDVHLLKPLSIAALKSVLARIADRDAS